MTKDSDYLAGSEVETWTWRVEDSWGEPGEERTERLPKAEAAPEAEAAEEEEESYLRADINDSEWRKALYRQGEEPADVEDTSKVVPEGGATPPEQPVAAFSLYRVPGEWDEEVPEESSGVRGWWDEQGRRIGVPLLLLVLVLTGITLLVLNVYWAAQ